MERSQEDYSDPGAACDHEVNFGRLEIEVTVDDPKAYTKPWTVKLSQTIKLDTDLLDFVCVEDEKDSSHLTLR